MNERTPLEQVADTLQFCKGQLLLCRQVLAKEQRGYEVWICLGNALSWIFDAESELTSIGVHFATVTPATDAGEVLPPRRVLFTDSDGRDYHIIERGDGSVCVYYTRFGNPAHYVVFDTLNTVRAEPESEPRTSNERST